MTIPSDRYDEGYRAGLEAAERECCRLADASRLASGERYMLKVAGERIRALATQPPDPAPFCQECGGVLQPLGKRCTDCGATWQTAAEMDALERYRPKPAPAPAPALDVAEVLPLVRAIADGYKHRFGLGPARLDGCTKVCIAMMREVESIAGQRLLRLALDTRCESVIGYHNHQCVKEQGHNGDCRFGGTRWSQARRQDKDPDTAGEGGDHE